MNTIVTATLDTIRRHGWAVQIVSDHGCRNQHDERNPRLHTGLDPYLYTVGLTEAGLPELLLQMPGRDTVEWLQTGQRLLNQVAAHCMHQELSVGDTLSSRIGRSITVEEPPPFSRAHGDLWPGMAYRLYGRRKVRVLEIVPTW